MHLVQVFLPLCDNAGQRFPQEEFDQVRETLTESFGGVTAYSRAPAEGTWKDPEDSTDRDDIVVYEVMADQLDRRWWSEFRTRLEKQFRQEELVVRALPLERL